MSTLVCNTPTIAKSRIRPSTPINRHCSTLYESNRFNNVPMQLVLLHVIDQLKDSTDSSTQLLIRLYHHKAMRLGDQPEKLYLFQQEIYAGLRQLHPSIIHTALSSDENQFRFQPEPTVTSRSAQATIRKLH